MYVFRALVAFPGCEAYLDQMVNGKPFISVQFNRQPVVCSKELIQKLRAAKISYQELLPDCILQFARLETLFLSTKLMSVLVPKIDLAKDKFTELSSMAFCDYLKWRQSGNLSLSSAKDALSCLRVGLFVKDDDFKKQVEEVVQQFLRCGKFLGGDFIELKRLLGKWSLPALKGMIESFKSRYLVPAYMSDYEPNCGGSLQAFGCYPQLNAYDWVSRGELERYLSDCLVRAVASGDVRWAFNLCKGFLDLKIPYFVASPGQELSEELLGVIEMLGLEVESRAIL